jgi:predicted transcriptional regulator
MKTITNTLKERGTTSVLHQQIASPHEQEETDKNNEPAAKIRVSLDISPELYEKLQSLARDIRGTKSDVLRKSIALMDVAVQARKQGKKIGLADSSDQLTTEIIGFEY